MPQNPRFFAFAPQNPLQKPRFFPKTRKNIHKFTFPAAHFREEPPHFLELETNLANSQGNTQEISQELGRNQGFPRQNFAKMRGGAPFRAGNHGFFRGHAQNHGFRAGNYQNFRAFAENPAKNLYNPGPFAQNPMNFGNISQPEANKMVAYANIHEKKPRNFAFPTNNPTFSPKNNEFVGNFEKIPQFSPGKSQNLQHFSGFPRENFAKKPMNHPNNSNQMGFNQFPGNPQKFRQFPAQNPLFMRIGAPGPYFSGPTKTHQPFTENGGNNGKNLRENEEIVEEKPVNFIEKPMNFIEKPPVNYLDKPVEKPGNFFEKPSNFTEKPANFTEKPANLIEKPKNQLFEKPPNFLETPQKLNLSENSQDELEKSKILLKLNEISGEHREEFVQKLKNLLKTSTSENKGTLEKMVSLFSAKVEEKEEKKLQLANKMQSMGIFLGLARENKEIEKEVSNINKSLQSKDPRLREKPKENC